MRYIQVEVTRNCSENCLVCPHRKWKIKREMDLNLFLKESNLFPKYDIVYLQGWGEPLQHNKIVEMLEIAKKKSKKTGFTTNGRKLKKFAEKVVKVTDYLLVSFAGVNSHDELRSVNFDIAMEGVKAISEVKESTNSKIRIGVSYMLTTLNYKECEEFVRIAKEAGAEYVAFTNLDYVFDSITDELRLFGKNGEEEVEKAVNLAKKLGMKVKAYPLKLEEKPVCDANPHFNVTVSCEGEIYPCIYLCLPFKVIDRIFEGKRVCVEKPYFGNIDSVNNTYLEFVQKFERRISTYNNALSDIFFSSPFTAIRKLENLKEVLERYQPPKVCRSCYKLYL